jgi:ribosomal-protein-alanine N-acetyltransferase
LNKRHWKQGVMSEAIEPILQWGFTCLSLQTIRGYVIEENQNAQRLMNKFHFQNERRLEEEFKGRLCKWIVYSLSKDDFINRSGCHAESHFTVSNKSFQRTIDRRR